MSCFVVTHVLLKTTHDMVGIAKKKVLREIHSAQELLVSTSLTETGKRENQLFKFSATHIYIVTMKFKQ